MREDVKVLRVKEIMRLFHLTQTAMSAKTGIDQGNLSGILSGKRPCGNGIIDKIALSFPDINREWLLTGEGEMLKSTPTVQQDNVHGNNNYNNNMPVRVCECKHCCDSDDRCAECGKSRGVITEDARKPIIPTEWSYRPNIDIFKEVLMNLDKVSRSMFIVLDCPIDMWLVVRDDSLAPRAYRGDSLGLSQYPPGMEDPIWGKFHAIDTVSNGLVVRKLYPADGGYRCVSPNEDYPELFIKFDNIISISRVVYVVRKAL